MHVFKLLANATSGKFIQNPNYFTFANFVCKQNLVGNFKVWCDNFYIQIQKFSLVKGLVKIFTIDMRIFNGTEMVAMVMTSAGCVCLPSQEEDRIQK